MRPQHLREKINLQIADLENLALQMCKLVLLHCCLDFCCVHLLSSLISSFPFRPMNRIIFAADASEPYRHDSMKEILEKASSARATMFSSVNSFRPACTL